MGDNKVMNPQRQKFKELYCNPESESFGNALGSAVAAGFSESYAKVIMNRGHEWAAEMIRDHQRASKAEEVLDDMMDMEVVNTKVTKFGEVIYGVDTGLVKIKQDTAKFVSETINKVKYSKRTELTGPGGVPLLEVEPATQKQINSALDEYLNKRSDNKKDSG